jgi:hypothetical protein
LEKVDAHGLAETQATIVDVEGEWELLDFLASVVSLEAVATSRCEENDGNSKKIK